VLERALAEELADHLVYDIGDSARAWIGSRKEAAERLVTDAASIDLEVPESAGTPEPQIVCKGSLALTCQQHRDRAVCPRHERP
jgi:hypothetical protein